MGGRKENIQVGEVEGTKYGKRPPPVMKEEDYTM